jgi:tRNA A37 threonylcarbamoyladenosine dehydratase
MPLSVKLGYGTKNWESVRVSQVKQTILVTSGAGYIGSHVVWALQRVGYSVILLYGLV